MNPFKVYLESSTDPRVYPKLAAQPLSTALLFLFFLLVLVGVPLVGSKLYFFHQKNDVIFENIRTSVPDFTIANGRLRSAQPVRTVLYQDADLILILDTTGHTRPSVLKNRPTGMMFTADRILFSVAGSEPAELSLDRLESPPLTKRDLLETRWVFEGFFLFWGLFLQLLEQLFYAFFFASLGFLGTFATSRPFSFQQTFGLAVFAQSMPITLQAIMMGFFPDYGQISNITFISLCIYYTLAIFFTVSAQPDPE
ncbi:MAG: DUF1189 family protein [Solirubrobacterales bacterium]